MTDDLKCCDCLKIVDRRGQDSGDCQVFFQQISEADKEAFFCKNKGECSGLNALEMTCESCRYDNCLRGGMWPEIIKKDMKFEKNHKISWADLQAVSFDEINKETEGTTLCKCKEFSMECEQNRIRMNEKKKTEHQFVSYRHKKFGNVYHRIT